MKNVLTRSALLGLLAVSGCASLSKSQCLAQDWQTIGYRDGANGTPSSALMRHQNACGKHGVVPDRDLYLTGWRNGVAQYCQPANGFSVGQRGAGYDNVCPPALQGRFLAAYREGQRLHRAQAEIDDMAQDIQRHERRLEEIEESLTEITAGVLKGETDNADRAAMLVKARNLGREQGELEAVIAELRERSAVAADRLAALRRQASY